MLSVDLFANETADANIVVSETESWTKQGEEVKERQRESKRGRGEGRRELEGRREGGREGREGEVPKVLDYVG